jgi:hypothetical protein
MFGIDTKYRISALSQAIQDTPCAVRFCPALGFDLIYGGEDAFTSFRTGSRYLNLMAQPDDRQRGLVGRGDLRHRPR